MSARVLVITYHAIGGPGGVLTTPPEVLRAQLAAWRAAGIRFLRLDEFEGYLAGTLKLESDALLLTFDDGLLSVYTDAFPIMQELGVPGTLFLVSDAMGRDNRFPGQPDWVPTLPIMSWEQAKELAANGFDVGSHTRRHPPLGDAALTSDLQDEVGGAAALMARELGRPMTAFAYPYGSLNGAVRQEVGAHHRLAFTTEMGPAMVGDDPLLIRRIDAFYLQAPAVYTRLFTTAGRAYLAGRAMARRLRGH